MTISEYQDGKEVDGMQESYEAPELIFIGRADEVVLGMIGSGNDGGGAELSAWDFEFEQD